MPKKMVDNDYLDDDYYEVELADWSTPSFYTREKIAPSVKDERTIKFKEMKEVSQYYYNNFNYWQNNAKIFTQQAKIMLDFTDDYEIIVPLQAYFTTFSVMNNGQLRTYFTWRTKVRQGQVEETFPSYAFCYLYELINNIGVKDADDGIEKLLSFWTSFRQYYLKIDHYLSRWLKDYYLVNNSTYRFAEILKQFPIPYHNKHELLVSLRSGYWPIEIVEANSQHIMSKMAFYQKGNQKVIKECLNAIFIALNNFFNANGTDFMKLYVTTSLKINHTPFHDAVYLSINGPDKTVQINDYELYTCKNGHWLVTEQRYTYFSITKSYILRTVEIEMRKAFGIKQQLKAPQLRGIKNELHNNYYSDDQDQAWSNKVQKILKTKKFEQTIQEAIKNYLNTSNISIKDGTIIKIKPVEIDLGKIDKIRTEHEATAKKLIIEEDPNGETTPPSTSSKSNTMPELPTTPAGFIGLLEILDDNELSLIKTLWQSQIIPSNCELLVEQINKKSLACINDNLIDYQNGIPILYDEYHEEINILLGGNI